MRTISMLVGLLCLWIGSSPAMAREFRYQGINLGPARAQTDLYFYTELPQGQKDLSKLTRHHLPCGTSLQPIALQLLDDGDHSLAFVTFIAPHASGHILLEGARSKLINLQDYFLFDPQGRPFCEAVLEQTLSQCGTVGVSLSYGSDSILRAEVKNLTSNQVFYLDWTQAYLIAEGHELHALPSDLYMDKLQEALEGKSTSVVSSAQPLDELTLLGLGTRLRLRKLAADSLEQDLQTLEELSQKVKLDLSGMLLEPLMPGKSRDAALSIEFNDGWKLSNLFLPSTRGLRYTLILPVARTELAQPEPTQTAERPALNTIFPQGSLASGTVQIAQPKALPTEQCKISFLLH